MLKDYFIKQGIKEAQIEEFIRKNFPLGDYSRTELQRTPLGIKIVIHTNKPGRIIGRGGQNINEMTEAIKKHFNLENPQLDVKKIENPNLDASIVAKQIASALEKGFNYKKIGNLTVKRVMDSGAMGVQIVISGKLGGGKGAVAKFIKGYLKHSGDTREKLVDEGFEEALTKPGKIGVKVMIMKEFRDITGRIRNITEMKHISEDLAKPLTEVLAEVPDEDIEKPKEEKKAKARKPSKKAAPKKEQAKPEAKPVVTETAPAKPAAEAKAEAAEKSGDAPTEKNKNPESKD
jgi:small subunit ribosomal protein S3